MSSSVYLSLERQDGRGYFRCHRGERERLQLRRGSEQEGCEGVPGALERLQV